MRLYEAGKIYRGPRLINWSPGLKTAVSDLEVIYSEEPGTLYYFKYMLAGSGPATGTGEYIPVATPAPRRSSAIRPWLSTRKMNVTRNISAKW